MKTPLIGQSVTRQNLIVRRNGCPGPWGIECLCFMQIKDCARNRNMCCFRMYICLETISTVSEQFFLTQISMFNV